MPMNTRRSLTLAASSFAAEAMAPMMVWKRQHTAPPGECCTVPGRGMQGMCNKLDAFLDVVN